MKNRMMSRQFLETRAALNASIAVALVADLGAARSDVEVETAVRAARDYWRRVSRRAEGFEVSQTAQGEPIIRRLA